MELTIEEEHDQWMVVLVLLVIYTAFFFAALGVAIVFLDPATPHQLPALYISWAVCGLLFTPILCYVRTLLPLTPAAAGLAFKRVGCPLSAAIGLLVLDYLAVTAKTADSRYIASCVGAATVSFAGLLAFCACLVREHRDGELGSVHHAVGASDDIV